MKTNQGKGGEMAKEQFNEMNCEELQEILGSTVKEDNVNKVITFLSCLSAYTESEQNNISYNAPSSTGKSYIPLEVSAYFPEEDLKILGYCSPTAFFHDTGKQNEKGEIVVDLSRKIIIFLDQPHALLLQHLRPLLSHDKMEISLKITDKTKSSSLRAKNILLKGYPAIIFCSAGLGLDEQEATRFFLLSPETTQEKIRQAVYEKIKKETDKNLYAQNLKNNVARENLMRRVLAIKQSGVSDIRLGCPELVEKIFLHEKRSMRPRDTRDTGRLISLVKMNALLNLWHRRREGGEIVSTEKDVDEALKLWNPIYASQSLNLPMYVHKFYMEIIVPTFKVKGDGLKREEISKAHYNIYGRPLPEWYLRREILPLLQNTGLIYEEAQESDKRVKLIFPMEYE